MKNIKSSNSGDQPSVLSFTLAQSSSVQREAHQKLAGFAKVLAGGRVVGINNQKTFADRMISDGVSKYRPKVGHGEIPIEQVILESVATNLEAGLKLLDKQELALARMGGRLSEMALCLNRSRQDISLQESAQVDFSKARANFRSLAKETFDHTALFSSGPSEPIRVAVPARRHWEEYSIDRCDLKKPGFIAIDSGKVSAHTEGVFLDPKTFNRVFLEWRFLCTNNRMQWFLIRDQWKSVLRTLKHFLGGRRWIAPPFPDDPDGAPPRNPHILN